MPALRLTFRGSTDTTSEHNVGLASEPDFEVSEQDLVCRVRRVRLPKALIDNITFLTITPGTVEQGLFRAAEKLVGLMEGTDPWVQYVDLQVEDRKSLRFPYQGWASSPEALVIFPSEGSREAMLASGKEAPSASAACSDGTSEAKAWEDQMALARAVYRWANWAEVKLPLNAWSPDDAMIEFPSYVLTPNSSGFSFNRVSTGHEIHPVNPLATPDWADVITKRAEEVATRLAGSSAVVAHARKHILPTNEIMMQPVELQEDFLRVGVEVLRALAGKSHQSLNAPVGTSTSMAELQESGQATAQVETEILPTVWGKHNPAERVEGKPAVTDDASGKLNWKSPLAQGGPFSTLPAPGAHVPPAGSPHVLAEECWTEDWFLGQQMLQGVAPTLIALVRDALPKKLALDDETLGAARGCGSALLGGLTLPEAIRAKRLYMVDLEILDGVSSFSGGAQYGSDEKMPPRYLCAAIGLFFLSESLGQLMPVAIQLGQDPAKSQVVTPRDSLPAWVLAKMFFQSAVGQVHQVDVHALRTHLCAEPLEIAIHRTLPSCHPVFKLIKPHMRYTLQINMMARASLIAPGTSFDVFISTGASAEQWASTPLQAGEAKASYASVGYVDLFERAFARWSESDNQLPQAIAARGVDADTLRIDYPYRDDGMLVWAALREFVRGILRLHYGDDAAVSGDSRLQALASELRFAFGHRRSEGRGEGFPAGAFGTLEGLCDTVTGMLWGAGYQHSAVNYGQYDYYGYVPNMPLSMMRPVPAPGSMPESMDDLLAYLPSSSMAAQQITQTLALSTYEKDQVYLDQVDRTYAMWFDSQAERAVLDRFKQALDGIEEVVQRRNDKRRIYYQAFLPSSCPISITI